MLAASALALLVVGALYLGALSTLHDDRAAARAGRDPRAGCSSVHTVILGSLYPLGAVVQGKLADSIGLRVDDVRGGAALLAVQLVVRASGPGSPSASTSPSPSNLRELSRSRAEKSRRFVRCRVAAWQSSNSNGAARSRSSRSTVPRRATRSAPKSARRWPTLLDEIEADADLARRRRHRSRRSVLRGRRPEGRRGGPRQRHRDAGRAASRASSRATSRSRSSPRSTGPRSRAGSRSCSSCDLVVAAETARFGIPEVKRGLMAAAGGLIRLPKRVPLAVALELAMTGDPIDASARARTRAGEPRRARRPGRRRSDRARRTHRRELADRGAHVAPARARGRRAHRGRGLGAHPRADGPVFESGDAIEGATAFAEKRAPVWKST